MIHTGIRAYVFNCSYASSSWVDDPTLLISSLQSALSTISHLSYLQLKVANVKSITKKVEIEILSITYKTKTRLNASEIDDLISDLNTALLAISDLSFLNIDICTDIFNESPTFGWPS
jgi:hypothetical protein